MRRFFRSALAAAVLVPFACAPSATPPSPFAPEGKLEVPGVIAVIHVKAPFDVEDASAELLVLDRERYGAPIGAVFSGAGRERLFARLLAESSLTPDAADPTAFAVSLHALEEVPIAAASRPASRSARSLARFSTLASGFTVRRFDESGAIALIPTIDLRETAFGLARAIASDPVGEADRYAAAISGAEVARMVATEIQPIVRSAAAMRQAFGSKASRVDVAMVGLEIARRALEDIARWNLRVRDDATGYVAESSIAARDGSPLAEILAALSPVAGEWPESVARVAIDPVRMAAALERAAQAYATGPDADAVRESLTGAARTFRETGIDRACVDALHLGPGVDAEAATRSVRALLDPLRGEGSNDGARTPTLANGWLFFAEPRPVASVAADADTVAVLAEGDDGSIIVRRTSSGLEVRAKIPLH